MKLLVTTIINFFDKNKVISPKPKGLMRPASVISSVESLVSSNKNLGYHV